MIDYKKFLLKFALTTAIPAVALAQVVTTPIVNNESGGKVRATPVITVDESGVYVAGGGGGGSGTEYTEDAAAAANPIGGVVQCVRRDTLTAAEVSADGDIVTIKCTNKGEQVVRDADVLTSLTTIDGRVDGLETAVASTNTKLDTLITDLGTLRTAIGTSASASDCDGSAALMSYSLCTAIKLTSMEASTTALQTFGAADVITVTFNRPADGNSYTALDMIADSTSAPTAGGFTITGACRANAGSVIIPDVWVMSNDTAALAAKILLLDTAVTTTPNDNAAEALSDADAAKVQGEIPFTLAARANNASAHVQNLNIQAKCLAGATTLKFLVQATGGALTTVSANTYTFKFKVIQVN